MITPTGTMQLPVRRWAGWARCAWGRCCAGCAQPKHRHMPPDWARMLALDARGGGAEQAAPHLLTCSCTHLMAQATPPTQLTNPFATHCNSSYAQRIVPGPDETRGRRGLADVVQHTCHLNPEFTGGDLWCVQATRWSSGLLLTMACVFCVNSIKSTRRACLQCSPVVPQLQVSLVWPLASPVTTLTLPSGAQAGGKGQSAPARAGEAAGAGGPH